MIRVYLGRTVYCARSLDRNLEFRRFLPVVCLVFFRVILEGEEHVEVLEVDLAVLVDVHSGRQSFQLVRASLVLSVDCFQEGFDLAL